MVISMIIVIDIELKDIKKDIYHFLGLVFFEDYDYGSYATMTEFKDNLEKHIDKDANDNYVCIINCKTKEYKVVNIQNKIQVVEVEHE